MPDAWIAKPPETAQTASTQTMYWNSRTLLCYVVLKIIIAKKDAMSGDNYVLLVSCRYAHIVDNYYKPIKLRTLGFAMIIGMGMWRTGFTRMM